MPETAALLDKLDNSESGNKSRYEGGNLILSSVSLLIVFPPSARRRSLTPCSCFCKLSLSDSAFSLNFCSCSTNLRACLIWKGEKKLFLTQANY